MIDGIQFIFHTSNPKTHLLGLPCWEVLINEKTGQKVNEWRQTNLRGLDIKLKPSSDGGFNLIMNGSLHKFYNNGEHNTDQFTFLKLFKSINSIFNIFGISTQNCKIHGLEIGVNIELPFNPADILQNVISYGCKPFMQLNKKQAGIGLQCILDQYKVKIYDKGKISKIECGNILRFEIAISKMKVIEKLDISNLWDLQDFEKAFSLFTVLNNALNKIIWKSNINYKNLSDDEQKQWLFSTNPNNWQTINRFKRTIQLKKWKEFLNKHGKPFNLHPYLRHTWFELFFNELEAVDMLPFHQHFIEAEALKNITLSPLECRVKVLDSKSNEPTLLNKDLSNQSINITITIEPNLCISCGRDISNQKNNSKFCSEKIYGKMAKQCRNMESNKQRTKNSKSTKKGKLKYE